MAINITSVIYDSNSQTSALTGNKPGEELRLIRYCSNATCEMTVSSTYPIDNDLYIMRNGNKTIYGKTGTFTNVESDTFTFSAQDSEGNVGTATYKVNMIPYVKPTCTMVNNRPDATGSMTVQCYGNFFRGNFGAADNSLMVSCGYKKQGDTDYTWLGMTVTILYNSYTAICSFTIPNFDYESAYVFECFARDSLSLANAAPITVRSTPVFHWGEDDFQFEVPVTMNGNATVRGDLRLKGSGNYGNTLRFGDGDYCYIAEKADNAMTLRADEIYLNGSVYVNNAQLSVANGNWTPTLNTSAISSYSAQNGWYNRVGDTVSVGFYIKATCNSGYDSTDIKIGGLPFPPSCASAGGGMCSGAYVGGGFNFQCFVAEVNSTVTARVQSCNNTSQTNLSTSASGCKYRSGGGEITLSGTITYMTYS